MLKEKGVACEPLLVIQSASADLQYSLPYLPTILVPNTVVCKVPTECSQEKEAGGPTHPQLPQLRVPHNPSTLAEAGTWRDGGTRFNWDGRLE